MASTAPIEMPSGTVTLLFTDIEGSTRLLQQLGSTDYATVVAGHHAIVRVALDETGGNEVKTEGDSFFAIFGRATDALAAAVRIQQELAAHTWPLDVQVAVRMGMHTGEVGRIANEYIGLDIHRAARISAAGHGGQIVLSGTTRDLVADRLPAGVSLLDLGEHRLKDLDQPEHLFQVVVEGLRSEFPPLRSLATRFDLLPAETTSFVGRERELNEARSLLEGTRLLTLTGPGGTGKTRLAIRLARLVADEFADGVAFVQLASIALPELVAPTIRLALRIAEEGGRPTIETLVSRLAEREVLLVLDNFEQVLPAAATVSTLLERCQRLKLIVTSRADLHVSGEQEYSVPPLAVTAGGEAVALLVDRAKAVRPDFELNAANADAVVAICRRLDGLPLAIELAASRLKLLPPAELLSRLERSLDLLQVSAVDRTDRQRTLRGAINWSYELLDDPHRRLFRRLAIFAGGFRLEDAEAVVVAPGPVDVDVLDGVSALVDNSLVRPLGDYPDMRFGMLETILEFGREQARANGEFDALAEALARRVAMLAEAAEPHLTSGPVWLDRLEANHDNIRFALAWLAEHDIESALEMGAALWRFWHRRGHLREGAARMRALLELPAAAPLTRSRARALLGLAGVTYWQLDYDAAKRAYEEALGIARSLGDEPLQADIAYSLAYTHALDGDLPAAQASADEAAAMYGRLGDEMGVASTVMVSSMLAELRGEQEHALQLMDQVIPTFERADNYFGLINTLGMKLRVLVELGRFDEARELDVSYLKMSLEQNELTSVSAALLDAASLEAVAGRTERAARLYGAGQRAADDAGGEAPPQLVRRIELMPMLEAKLGRATLASLIAEGRQMAPAAAVAYALGEAAP
jgi:predicted ATPase/class 3 adenylate cyclase